MKKYLVAVLICFGFISHAQQAGGETSLVKWMKLEDAMKAYDKQPKPIIIDFYTDWCGWCKRMMATTYSNQGLAAYINQNFYPVKFDAEGKDTVEFLGKKYTPLGVGQRMTHALAAKLLQNKMMYPTTLFLNNLDKTKNEFALNMLASGYLDEKKIEPMLVFSLENAFRNSGYEDFGESFQKAFYDSTTDNKINKLKWLTPKEYFSKTEKHGKKALVYIGTDWCNSCKVMKRTAFTDDSSAALIKEKFDLVDFNPEYTDSVSYKGQLFSNSRQSQFPFHQLTLELTRRNFVLPSLVVLDEDMNIVDSVPFYINPNFMKDITRFYGSDIYKKKSWKEFQESIHPVHN